MLDITINMTNGATDANYRVFPRGETRFQVTSVEVPTYTFTVSDKELGRWLMQAFEAK